VSWQPFPSEVNQKEQELEMLRAAVADLNRRLSLAAPILEKEFHFTEDELRNFIIERVPELRLHALALTGVLRQSVAFEERKKGYEHPKGSIALVPNEHRHDDQSPDLVGKGRVANRLYDAAGWLAPNNSLRVVLIPHKHHGPMEGIP
jgi:hypothetical protein